MSRRASIKTMAVGVIIGSAIMLILFLGLQASAAQAADDINANAIYFSWWYVLGTLVAFFEKIFEGIIKHVPAKRFSWRKLGKIFLISAPFLLINVFFFLPKYGPTTGNWQKDVLYSFLSAYATLGIGSSLEDFRRYLDYLMDEEREESEE